MSLTLRQSFNVFACLQLDRVKAIVMRQTPPDLHRLPVASVFRQPGVAGSLEGRNVARPVRRQVNRTNYKADCELTPGQLRKRRKNQRYQAMLRAQRDLFALEGES